MILHKDSHLDHLPVGIINHILARFANWDGSFVETTELPHSLGQVECGLYGPTMGDPPISDDEVVYQPRPGRTYTSRLVDRPLRQTRFVTVVAGPYGEDSCVLYTIYGGSAAPREPDDPAIKSESERLAAETFWSQHALSMGRS